MRRVLLLGTALSAVALLLSACPTSSGGGSGSCTGDEGCRCYTDGTCENGLICREDVCVAGETDMSRQDVGPDIVEDTAPDIPAVDLTVEDGHLEVGDEPDLSTNDTTDANANSCAEVGEACDPGQAQPAQWVCAVEDNPAEGICLHSCVDTCADGFCYDGACWPTECSGFWEDDCGGDTDCVPMTATYNVCYDNGPAVLGDACTDHDQCAEGLFCLGNECFAPECAPVSETVTCANPAEECDPLGAGLDVGICYEPCLFFDDTATCSVEGTFCFPTNRQEVGDRIEGVCVESDNGTAQLGDTCDLDSTTASEICQDGLLCLDDECLDFCDPESETTEEGACAEGYCAVLTTDSGDLDFGACLPTCTPWTADHQTAGCEANEWCMASLFETEGPIGFCEPTGAATQGVGCGYYYSDTMCAADLICLGSCEPICDPDATEGGDGDTCGDGEVCERVSYTTGEETEVGYCQPVCDHDLGTECTGDLTCVLMEFFIDATEDICIDLDGGTAEGATCPTDYGQYDICNTFSLCDYASGDSGPLTCYEACRTSEGAFGTDHHPDCTRELAVCTDVWDIEDFGACN